MTKITSTCAKLFFLLILLFTIAANAQKLPKIQETSIRSPNSLKIDGKTTEWNDKLQAYSPVNLVNYTVSNDDNNLYLTVYAADPSAVNKISQGGITFTVSHSLDKKLREKASDNISIRFPVTTVLAPSGIGSNTRQYQELKKDALANKKAMDSLVLISNKKFAALYKEIQVIGIKEIADSAVSIFNEQGIKVAVTFNKTMAYTYELAIPLKSLGIGVDGVTKFSYNLKLKGSPSLDEWVKANRMPPPSVSLNNGGVNFESNYLDNPTDIWGEYTLIKK